jgi:chromosomal replication initiation ATPase DnaA
MQVSTTLNPYVIPGIIPSAEEIILKSTCEHFKTSYIEILSKSRRREIVRVRQWYCYFAKQLTLSTLGKIGYLVNYDHSAVIYSVNNIQNFVSNYPEDKLIFSELSLKIAMDLKRKNDINNIFSNNSSAAVSICDNQSC